MALTVTTPRQLGAAVVIALALSAAAATARPRSPSAATISSTATDAPCGCSASTARAPSTPASRAGASSTARSTTPRSRRWRPGTSTRSASRSTRTAGSGFNGVKPALRRSRLPAADQGLRPAPHARRPVRDPRPALDRARARRWRTGQQPMPDADHSPAFWRSVAQTFRATAAVVFDLYNEPHDVTWAAGATAARYHAAAWIARPACSSLVEAVRATGARQPVMLGGLGWSSDLSAWLALPPARPGSTRSSPPTTPTSTRGCSDAACWNADRRPASRRRCPVVTGELGENDCGHGYIDQLHELGRRPRRLLSRLDLGHRRGGPAAAARR